MRIPEKDLTSIRHVFQQQLSFDFELYVFGSRTDMQKKGGDIDLLVVVAQAEFERVQEMKFLINHKIQELIGEQRIDITVATPEMLGMDPFLKSIFPEARKVN